MEDTRIRSALQRARMLEKYYGGNRSTRCARAQIYQLQAALLIYDGELFNSSGRKIPALEK